MASEWPASTPFLHEVPFDLSDPEEVERMQNLWLTRWSYFLLINNVE